MPIDILALRQPPSAVMAALPDDFAVTVVASPQEIAELDTPKRFRGLINFSGALTGDTLNMLPGLEIVSHMGVGYDGVDIAAARARGVIVTHTRDVLNADVANYAFLMLLAASRELVRQDTHVRQGHWAQGQTPLTWSIEGQTVGIVGMGRIGRNLAQKLEAFNVTVLYHGRTQQDVPYEFCPDLAAMAARCKALVLLLPGGPDTEHLIDADVLAAMPAGSGLVNAARGSVVDQNALIEALQSGALAWAALDVFADEPQVPEDLRAMPNVLLSPHAASATVETRNAMFRLVAENIRAHFMDGAALTPIPECADMLRA